MKSVTNTFQVSINAKPEDVFAYVSDLTKHGEWNDGLKVEAVTSGPINVGNQYRSWGKPGYRLNQVTITDYQPPTRFTFVSRQAGWVDVQHEFVVRAQNGGTILERILTTNRPLLGRLVLWPLVGRPAMNRCLAALKSKLERLAAQA
jgi:hypothetical protein